jgi:hypothetical protein
LRRTAEDYNRFITEVSAKTGTEAEFSAWLEEVIREKLELNGSRPVRSRLVLGMMLHSTLRMQGMQEAVAILARLRSTRPLVPIQRGRLER